MTNAQKKQELNNKLSLPIPESEKEAARTELARIKDLPDDWDYAAEGESASEQVIKANEGKTSADVAAQRLTPEQQGIQAKGNQGDNVNNPNALNSAEIDRLHKEELASAQTPENMNPDTFSPDRSIREEAEAKKSPEVEAVTSVAQPKEGDTPKETKAKGKYNQSMMSIWDAYHQGLIDKETAGYFTIDAIATLAKNLGRSMGNVAAQFSGGTIDQGHDESRWEQRQDKMFNTELQKESEGVDTFDNLLKGYQVDKAATVNDMLNDFNAKANDPKLPETEKRFYQVLAAELAGAGLDGNAQVATIGAGVWDDLKSKVGELVNKDKK